MDKFTLPPVRNHFIFWKAIAKTPAKRPAFHILSVIAVFAILVFKVQVVSLIP
jgi:hypothetical protein